MAEDELSSYLQQNPLIAYLIVFGIVLLVVILIIRRFKGVDKKPDYLAIYHKKAIDAESLNLPDTFIGVKTMWHGDRKMGKVLTYSTVNMRLVRWGKRKRYPHEQQLGMPEPENPQDVNPANKINVVVHTITFRKPWWRFYGFKKHIVRFSHDTEHILKKDRLIFPEYQAFNAVGGFYLAVDKHYGELCKTVDMDYHKFLYETNVHTFSSLSAGIAAERPDSAIQLKLKDKEIELEKEKRKGQISSIG